MGHSPIIEANERQNLQTKNGLILYSVKCKLIGNTDSNKV